MKRNLGRLLGAARTHLMRDRGENCTGCGGRGGMTTQDWSDFFAELAEFQRMEAAVRRERVGIWTLCSLYLGASQWDVWIE